MISGDTSVVLNEDAIISGDLNATDVEGLTDGSYFSITTAPNNGSSIIDPTDGNWTYTPVLTFTVVIHSLLPSLMIRAVIQHKL